jgi:hypothetical protein
MKRVAGIIGSLALVAASVAVFAQAKPNFAGKWTLVPDPNAQPAAGGRGRGGGGLGNEFNATQNDKTLTVVTNNPQMGEIKATYNLDGSETKNPITFNGNTVERTSKAKWDGNKLVLTTTTNFNGNAAETTQAWTLDASGSLLVETTSNFGGNPTTTKATYKKG